MKEKEIETPWLYLAGPIFLLCTLAVAVRPYLQEHLYLLAIALICLFSLAYFRMQGRVLAILSFVLAAAVMHGFFTTHHLWQLGLEGSLACGLLITTLALEQRRDTMKALHETSKTRETTISHLEEDLAKLMETSSTQQIVLQEKLSEKQKELEELHSEHGTILVLNEVLRKTSAKNQQETEQLSEISLNQERRIGSLLTEIDDLQKELTRVSNLSGLTQENASLLKELNSARIEKEQTHLINETLVKLHAKENQKAQEAAERFHTLMAEKQRCQEELGASKVEIQMLSTHLEQLTEELEKSLTSLKAAERIQIEKTFLQERLHTAERDLAAAVKKSETAAQPQAPAKESMALQAERELLIDTLTKKEGELKVLEERTKGVSQIEALYKQLKSQFEEKNAILHETRAKLFQADTELQKLQMEKEQTAADPIASEFQQEILDLEKEVADLKFENEQLQAIITRLSQPKTE